MKPDNKNTQSKQDLLLGNAYFIVPRKILKGFFSLSETQKEQAIVLLALLNHSYHTEGIRSHLGTRMKCDRGEYIGSYPKLADMTGLSRYTAQKTVEELVKQSFISLEKIKRGIRIRFDAYLQFLDQYPNREARARKQGSKPVAPQVPYNPLQDLQLPSDKQLKIIDLQNNTNYEQ